jgi:hypothetical protein
MGRGWVAGSSSFCYTSKLQTSPGYVRTRADRPKKGSSDKGFRNGRQKTEMAPFRLNTTLAIWSRIPDEENRMVCEAPACVVGLAVLVYVVSCLGRCSSGHTKIRRLRTQTRDEQEQGRACT